MRARQITLLLVLNFVIALAAGVVAGRALAGRSNAGLLGPTTMTAGDSFLGGQLQLTPEQTEKMRPIWEAARDTAQECAREADRIQRDNETQLQELLTEPQKTKYEQITAEHHRRIVEQDEKRKEAFRQAVEQTHGILRAEQWTAYEQILKNQVGTVP